MSRGQRFGVSIEIQNAHFSVLIGLELRSPMSAPVEARLVQDRVAGPSMLFASGQLGGRVSECVCVSRSPC